MKNKQVQQQNIATPPEPKRHSFLTSKLFLIILAILILFTAVYAGIYLFSKSSPTPLPSETLVKEGDPTANWQTYRNDEFGFEMKYPDFSNDGFIVSIHAPVQVYEVLPAEALHPQSQEIDWVKLRERVNTKVLLNSFQDEQKNHFDLYIPFSSKEEGAYISFEYSDNAVLGIDEIALINKILSTFQFTN